MVILGIDPGSVRIGFGVIKKEGPRLTHLGSGLLEISSDESNRLPVLEKDFLGVLRRFKPQIVGIEKLFFAKNRKTAIKVAEARGVLLNALSKEKVSFVEIAPSEVKLAVAGAGGASKESVAKMVKHFLKIRTDPLFDDVTDALAIAIAVSNRQLFINKG